METDKKKIKNMKAHHLIMFRRYLRLENGYGSIDEYLSMNCFELRQYIEERWKDGMTWDNYGKLWVVDHIVPMAYFNLRDMKDKKICWHHKNLLPNFLSDNHAKGYCLELALKVLDTIPQCSITTILKNRINQNIQVHNKYYQIN